MVVAGLGAVFSLGPSATEFWERLLASESGIRQASAAAQDHPRAMEIFQRWVETVVDRALIRIPGVD
jgi:hypothetical protein